MDFTHENPNSVLGVTRGLKAAAKRLTAFGDKACPSRASTTHQQQCSCWGKFW